MFVGQNIPGGSIGGPIIKEKFFFFVNFQALRLAQTSLVRSPVYTSLARQGIYRYVIGGQNRPAAVAGASVDLNGNVISGLNIGTYDVVARDPQGIGLDPTIRALINSTPLPNDFTTGDGLNVAAFSFNAPVSEIQQDYTIKLDYVINPRQTISGRGSWGRQDSLCDPVNGGQRAFPGFPCQVDAIRRPRNIAINHRWNPTASTTNELVLGLNRFQFLFGNPDPNALSNPPFVFGDIVSPLSNVPPITNARTLTTIQVADNFSVVAGAHTVKAGINLRFGRHIDVRSSVGGVNTQPSVNFNPTINTVGAAFQLPSTGINSNDLQRLQRTVNNLLGRVGSISQGFVAVNPQAYGPRQTFFTVDTRYPEYDFYVQDTWRLNSRLIVDAGLRWEVRPAMFARGGKLGVPNQPIAFGAAPTNTAAWFTGKPFSDDTNNFAPSFGVAWDPFGSGKTSIRANYRLAFDRLNTFLTSSAILPNIPGTSLGVVNNTFGTGGGRIPNLPTLVATGTPEAGRQPAAFGAGSVTVFDRNYRTPKVHQWALSIQRELPYNLVLEANYIGRSGNGLLSGYNANQIDIFQNGFLNAFNTVRPCVLAGTFNSSCDSPLFNTLLASPNGSQTVFTNFAGQIRNNSVGEVAASLMNSIGANLATRTGNPFFFVPFPQFSGGAIVIDSFDFSTYHAAQVQLSRQYKNGLSFQVGYTFSKSLDTRSFDPTQVIVSTGSAQSASSTPFDVRNRAINYARSDFDRTHALQGYFLYELPFGRGRRFASKVNAYLDAVIGGWSSAGIFRLVGGRPFTVYSGANTLSTLKT